jgi:hypothetical protein
MRCVVSHASVTHARHACSSVSRPCSSVGASHLPRLHNAVRHGLLITPQTRADGPKPTVWPKPTDAGPVVQSSGRSVGRLPWPRSPVSRGWCKARRAPRFERPRRQRGRREPRGEATTVPSGRGVSIICSRDSFSLSLPTLPSYLPLPILPSYFPCPQNPLFYRGSLDSTTPTGPHPSHYFPTCPLSPLFYRGSLDSTPPTGPHPERAPRWDPTPGR